MKTLKKNSKFQRWILTFGAIGAVIGSLIGQFFREKFDFASFLGALTAALLLISIDIVKNWRKKDTTPEFDERTTNNMIKFYAYASNGFILLSLFIFSILSFKGIESVSVIYILVILFIYFSLSGTTAIIISRR